MRERWFLLKVVHLGAFVALGLGLSATAARAANELDLAGTWFVVIHYTDEASNNPDAQRWLDKAWTLEPKGGRLQWTEYPIVVIGDQSGRFEAVKGNPRSRVLASWEPNTAQLEELLAGPRVNQRGSKSKSLRKSKQGNWASMGRSGMRSATVIGYTETWSIDDPTGLPRFAILDSVGGGTTQAEQGGSVYTATEVAPDGSEIRGSYERDGTRKGSFRMIRTAAVRGLLSSEEEGTVNERAWNRQMEEMTKRAQQAEIVEEGDEPEE